MTGQGNVEQRKILLIIASVTIVIAASIGVGMWLFYPRDGVDPGHADPSGSLEWEPGNQTRRDSRRPGLEISEPDVSDAEDGDIVVTYGVPQDEPRERTTPADGFVAEDTAPRPSAQPPRPAPAPPRPAPAPAKSAPATPAPAATTARPVTPSAPAVEDRSYWVQVISSPNRDTIERARDTLNERQLGTRIVTREIEGTMYYRLRLGPFAERAEAEKFLGWVNTIDGFADAMIFVDFTAAASLPPPR